MGATDDGQDIKKGDFVDQSAARRRRSYVSVICHYAKLAAARNLLRNVTFLTTYHLRFGVLALRNLSYSQAKYRWEACPAEQRKRSTIGPWASATERCCHLAHFGGATLRVDCRNPAAKACASSDLVENALTRSYSSERFSASISSNADSLGAEIASSR
jgi:hypothetical protein